MLRHSQKTKWWLICVVTISLAACFPTKQESGREEDSPPIELIEENVKTTDITVILEVIRVQHVETIGHYSDWEVKAKVVKSLKGNLMSGELFQYHRVVEGHSLSLPIGSRHLVSFVRKQNQLVIPDVAYHFPYTEVLEKYLDAQFP